MSQQTEGNAEIYAEPTVRARKPHRCGACGEPINVGQQYTSIFIVFDGDSQAFKRCVRCQKIHLHLRTLDKHHDLWPDERLNCGEVYEDHWGAPPPPEIAALAFALPADFQEARP